MAHRSSVIAATSVLTLVLAACGPAGGPSPGSIAPGADGSAGAQSAGGPVPGWPMPGQVTTSSLIPIIATVQLIVGPNRFLFTLIDQQNRPAASPHVATSLAFFDIHIDPAKPISSSSGSFVWAIPDERGFYTAPVTFGHPGEWGAEITISPPGGASSQARVRFVVHERGTTPPVGSAAPASKTRTLADVGGGVRRISTDGTPDPRFYETSVAGAISRKVPFVLVFATPAFCVSRVCGPTLETVKEVARTELTFTFINVEPYELDFVDGRLQPRLDASGQFLVTNAAREWGLPIEPWVFVVDGAGIVRASFEAVVSKEELRAAIASVR